MSRRPTGDNNCETEGILQAELQSFLACKLIYVGFYEACHMSAVKQAGLRLYAV